MATANAGHELTCQSLVLLDLRTSGPWGLMDGVKPQKTTPSLNKRLYLRVSVHHKYFLVTLSAAHWYLCPL